MSVNMHSAMVPPAALQAQVLVRLKEYARIKLWAPPDLGVVIGSMLRRTLLSAIPAPAITRFQITGVYHLYCTIPGVREDVLSISNNLKRVRIKAKDAVPCRLDLNVQGRGVVIAGDFRVPSGVEILNPDHPLFYIDDDRARVEMSCYVEVGVGYRSHEQINREREMTGRYMGELDIDAVFSPISRVAMHVEKSDAADTVILEIWGDGRVDPVDAFVYATNVIREQFLPIVSLEV